MGTDTIDPDGAEAPDREEAQNQTLSYKRIAAERAADLVQSGMIVGLGHGSTAIYAVRRIAALLREGKIRDILGVPCSVEIEREAQLLGIPLTTLDDHLTIDLTIDGADEVDPALNLIKGGGGALLREKIVAQASRREVIVVDHTKLVPALGTGFAVPVEVVPFGWKSQADYLKRLGARPVLRHTSDGAAFLTNQGNYILDCHFGPIADPAALAAQIKARAGVVEHGLFLGMATDVYAAGPQGVRHMVAGETGETKV